MKQLAQKLDLVAFLEKKWQLWKHGGGALLCFAAEAHSNRPFMMTFHIARANIAGICVPNELKSLTTTRSEFVDVGFNKF